MGHVDFNIIKRNIFHHRAFSVPHLNDAAAEMIAPCTEGKSDRTIFKTHVSGIVIGFINTAVSNSLIRPSRVVSEKNVIGKPICSCRFRFKSVVPRADETILDDGVFTVGQHHSVREYPIGKKHTILDRNSFAVVHAKCPCLRIDNRDSME